MHYRISKFNKFWNSVGIVPEIKEVVSNEDSSSAENDAINLLFILFFQI